jgi:hypothetical protein
MTLKQLKISEAKEIINNFNTSGDKIYTLVRDLESFNLLKNMEQSEEKMIKSFAVGGFIHYAYTNLDGKGIVNFYEKLGMTVSTLSDDKTVIQTEDFKIKNVSKNLAILSLVTDIKIGKGLLLKFVNVHSVIRNLDEILNLANEVKSKMLKV